MPKARAKIKHIEHKPELIELLLTEPINSGNDKGNPVLAVDKEKPVGFAEKFSLFLDETPDIGSTSDPEFFIHGIFGSALTLSDSGLVEKLGINRVYVKHTKEHVEGSKKVKGEANVVKICFSLEKGGKKQVALRVFTNDGITGGRNPEDRYRYNDDELKEIAGKLGISDIDNVNVDEHMFRIRTEGDPGNRSFRLHKWKIDGIEEKFKIAASSQSQINNEFKEISVAQSINLEDSFKELSDGNIKEVIGSTEKIFKEFASVYQDNQEKFSLINSEVAYHGFHYGALALNFRYRYDLNCYTERIAGNGRADLIFMSRTKDANGRINPKPIPIVVEFKGEGHTADEAIAQIKNKGYLYNLSVRTKAEEAVIVGIGKGGGLKVEKDDVFQSRGFARQILKEARRFNQNCIDRIKDILKGELKNLYYSIQSHDRHYLSKLVLGQFLAVDDDELDKYIFTYTNQDESIRREATTFVLSNQDEGKAVILNIIERSGEQRVLRGEKESDSKRIPPIDELKINSAVKIDVIINTGVQHKPDGFEVEGGEDKSYYQDINIEKVSGSSQGKFQGQFKKIESVEVGNLVKDLQKSNDIGRTRGDKKSSLEKLKESLSPLAEALFPFKGLIKKEIDFQAMIQGLFMNGETEDGKEIRVYMESNASPQGRIDLALSFTQLSESDGSLIEDDPIIIELKYANSNNDANRKLKQAEEQMASKYKILRSFTDKKTSTHLAIAFSNAAKNEKDMILASMRNVDVYHTTSGSSPEKSSAKRPGSPLAGCSKRRRIRSVGMLCVESRDEESTEEKKGKEEIIKELFDTNKIRERAKNIEFYDQLLKVSEQISKGEIVDQNIEKAFIAKVKDINLDSIDSEIRDIVKEMKNSVESKEEIKNILRRSGVVKKIGKVAEDAGLTYRKFLNDRESKSYSIVDKITSNTEAMNHLSRIGKISGWAMHGMMYKNLICDILSGNAEGVAINLGFIGGSNMLGKLAETAAIKGEKFISSGKLFLGRSLKAASPFLARGTTAFIIYDLVNQVNAYKAGNKNAMVGIVGDSIVLTTDVAEIGIEIAEVVGILEGVLSVTGPIGAAIGAIVFIGTDIYSAVKTAEREDEIIHLTRWEKFTEGWRAFFHTGPSEYLEELIEGKQANNLLVKNAIEFLKKNTDIQRYIFPSSEVYRTFVRDSIPICIIRNQGLFQYVNLFSRCTHTEVAVRIALNNAAYLHEKKDHVKWNRARPDNPREGGFFCLPEGDYESVPESGAYVCKNAIGLSYLTYRTGNDTLINLGMGNDKVIGFQNSPNVFFVDGGNKELTGGSKDDIFILHGSLSRGFLDGGFGNNTLDLTKLTLSSRDVVQLQDLSQISILSSNEHSEKHLRLKNIQVILGREKKQDEIKCATNLRYIDGNGGKSSNYPDRITINGVAKSDKLKVIVRPYTEIINRSYNGGSFDYTVLHGKGKASIDINDQTERLQHNFLFNYTLFDLKNTEVQNLQNRSDTIRNISFSFQRNSSGVFDINIRNITTSASYVLLLGDNTEIRIGSKGSLYALQSTDKPIDNIVRDYPAIAKRLNMTVTVQFHDEFIIVGHGKHEIMNNEPLRNSHLIGNGGENVYVITPTQKRINIYDVYEETSIDTLDLRNVIKRALSVSLKISQDKSDLLIKLEGEQSLLRFPIRMKNGIQWYEKLHVILERMPMQIRRSGNGWNLSLAPLTFDSNTKIAVITARDIYEGNKLIVHKQVGQHIFSRSRDDLIITTSGLEESDVCTILLSNFYKEPKMETLSIEFNNTIMSLQEKVVEINNNKLVFCSNVLQISEALSINSSNLLDNYDCLKFNSDRVAFFRQNDNLLLFSEQGVLFILGYYSQVHKKWSLSIELNNDVIEPERFKERADKCGSLRYYLPGEEGLQIYHNYHVNKYQVGLVDLRGRSMLEYNMEISNDSLVLLFGNNVIAKVENWGTDPQVRKMMFVFNDTAVVNTKCIISDCSQESTIEEFRKITSVNERDANGYTKLHYAILLGNSTEVQTLLGMGAGIDARTNEGKTLLHLAVKVGNPNIIELLLNNNADVNAKDNNGEAPLHCAVTEYFVHTANKDTRFNIVKLLLGEGASVKIKDIDGKTPFYRAIVFMSKLFILDDGNKDLGFNLLQLLLDKDTTVINTQDNSGNTSLHFAALNDKLDLVRYLINKGSNTTVQNSGGKIPLELARERKLMRMVSILERNEENMQNQRRKRLVEPFDLSAVNNVEFMDRNTTLRLAIEKGNLDVVQYLINEGTSIHSRNSNGWTPLHYAACGKKRDIVELLINKGADIYAKDNNGKIPFETALECSKVKITKFLTVAKDKYGYTALHYAAEEGNLYLAGLLLDNSADINAKNNDSWIPVQLATKNNKLRMVKFLTRRGANINIKNNYGWTSLHYAYAFGTPDMINFFINNGADIDAKTNRGEAPLEIVYEYDNSKVVNFLERCKKVTQHHIRHKHHKQHHREHYQNLQEEEYPIHLESRSAHRSRRSIKDYNFVIESDQAESGASEPYSWINDLFNWVKSSIDKLLSSNTTSSISQIDQQIDVNGAIMLLDVLVRKVTGQKYTSTVDQSISSLEAQGYALNIISEFEKVLNETAIKSGISVTNLNFDPVKTQLAIVGQIRNGKFSEISKTLYSFAKEACPEFQQTGKFLACLKSNLEGEKEAVLLQQKVEQTSDQQISRKVVAKELPKKPDTFLNGTSVVKGISNVLER